jgi:hypothetical protein
MARVLALAERKLNCCHVAYLYIRQERHAGLIFSAPTICGRDKNLKLKKWGPAFPPNPTMDIETTISAMLEDFSRSLLSEPQRSAELIRDMKWKVLDMCAVAYGTMDLYDALLTPIEEKQRNK